jgi:hypothetical protein
MKEDDLEITESKEGLIVSLILMAIGILIILLLA